MSELITGYFSKQSTDESAPFFAIAQKDKPPIVVTRSVGGQIVFTQSEFALRIGVTTNTLYNWRKNGWLVPAYRDVNDRYYYTEEQAQSYLKAGQKGKHTGRRV